MISDGIWPGLEPTTLHSRDGHLTTEPPGVVRYNLLLYIDGGGMRVNVYLDTYSLYTFSIQLHN